MTSIGGLSWPALEANIPVPRLPEIIQGVRVQKSPCLDLRALGTYISIKYSDIPELRSKSFDPNLLLRWRADHGISAEQILFLNEESRDRKLERLFPAIYTEEFFEAIVLLGPVVLVSPGYSVYDNGSMCEFLQFANQSRSIRFSSIANRHGFPCVPCLGWHRHRTHDIARIAKWLIAQGPSVTHLAVNAQTGGILIAKLIAQGITAIERQTQRQYIWIIFGGHEALATIARTVPYDRLVLVSSMATQYSSRHRLIGVRGTNDRNRQDLLEANIQIQFEKSDVIRLRTLERVQKIS